MALKIFGAYILAYLVGSINAAYILGRLLKGIDIREYGCKNAGTVNAFKVLGPQAGILTFVWDAAKGLLAMLIAARIFSLHSWIVPPKWFVYLAGYFAILGHDYPFYLGFRGGRGAACATGLLLFSIVALVMHCYISLPVFLLFGFFSLILLATVKSINITGLSMDIVAIGIINLLILKKMPFFSVYISLLCIYLSFVAYEAALVEHLPKLHWDLGRAHILPVRKLLRIAAVIFPVIYVIMGRNAAVILALVVTCLSFSIEFLRKLLPWVQKSRALAALLKKEERNGITGISYFALAALITIVVFPEKAAVIGISMAIFGDLLAEIIGLEMGSIKIVDKKTLEGTSACLAVCVIVGLVFRNVYAFGYPALFISAVSATLIELLPVRIGRVLVDDNFTMIFGTALVIALISPPL